MRRNVTQLTAGLSALLSCFTLSMAKADITSHYIDWFTWDYSVTHMADFDQRRADDSILKRNGLPNNGSYYCVPTSGYNLLQYAHAHGYPGIAAVDDKSCLTTPVYNQATADLLTIGWAMATDPFNGTNGDGEYNGMQLLLPGANAAYWGQFNVLQTFSYSGLPITLDWIGTMAMQGGVGNIAVGWYQWNPFLGVYLRNGGHCLTVVGIQKASNLAEIKLHDPNTNPKTESQSLQSAASDDHYPVVNSASVYGVLDSNNQLTLFGSLPVVQGLGGAIDECMFVVPAFGFTSDPLNIQFSEYHPYQFIATVLPHAVSFASQGSSKLISVALDPVRSSRYYIKQGEDQVWELDVMSGKSQVFAQVTAPKQAIVGGKLLTRYVLTSNSLIAYDNNHRILTQAALTTPLDQIAFDPLNNRILGVSRRTKSLYAFEPNNLKLQNTYALPAVQFTAGDLSLSVHPASGVLMLHCDNSDLVWKIASNRTGLVTVSFVTLQNANGRASGLNVDEAGNFYASLNGKIQAYTPYGNTWAGTHFNGLPSGRFLEISRSFSNYDPAIHTGPAYRSILH